MVVLNKNNLAGMSLAFFQFHLSYISFEEIADLNGNVTLKKIGSSC